MRISSLFISILLCQQIAAADYIFFQIQANNPHRISLQAVKVMIHGKGQIRLSTAKINDGCLPPRIQIRQNVFDKLQKTVDLTELIIPGSDDLPFFGHDTQIHQKFYRFSFLQHKAFFPVMSQNYF